MSRPLRIEFAGAYYHVLSRGNNRCSIFNTEDDYNTFLELLEEFADRFQITVYAYVLMGNHYHLLLRTNQANLSKAMQWLGTTYTRRFNIKNKQSGHLFQGRFKSILVENASYFLTLSCYIHRNPLRAGMVNRLMDYKWSSYPYYAYPGKQPAWLDTDQILSQVGQGKERYSLYRKKIEAYSKEKESVWEQVKFGFLYGSQSFADSIKDKYLPARPDEELPQLNRMLKSYSPGILIEQATQLLDCNIEDFRHAGRLTGADLNKRDALIILLWETGRYSNREIGELLGLTHSSVSKRLTRAKGLVKSKENHPVKTNYDKIKTIIKV